RGAAVGGEAGGGGVAALAAPATSPTFWVTNDQVLAATAKGGRNIELTPAGDVPSKGGDARGGGFYLDAGTSSNAQFLIVSTLMNHVGATGGDGGDPTAGGPNGTVNDSAAPGGSAWGGGIDAAAGDAFKPLFRLFGDKLNNCQATGGAGGQGTALSASLPATVGGLGGDSFGGGAVFDAG